MDIKVVAGGPLFTTEYEEFEDVDYFVLNEAEITLPPFLEDLRNGCAQHIYTSQELPDIQKTPLPLWDLIDMKKYAVMSIQYSRGCPYDCEFCNISALYGRKVRTKSETQIISELEDLYSQGWRGDLFFVDDNFVGRKRKLKEKILPAIIEWMERKRHPFSFNTEASIDLSDDDELMQCMVKAGFTSVFVGIETVNEESLAECNKVQNKNRDLVACVKKIQKFGLQVVGGFIVGFDSDPPIFSQELPNPFIVWFRRINSADNPSITLDEYFIIHLGDEVDRKVRIVTRCILQQPALFYKPLVETGTTRSI